MTQRPAVLPLALVLALASCESEDDSPVPPADTRPFAMAFTPWPHDATAAAANFTYTEILGRGDWVAHHLDQGIPWEEALQGQPYPQAVQDDLDGRVAATPMGTPVYLAITPLNGARDGLAARWGAGGAEPLQAPWDTRTLADQEVIDAFTAYALDLIQRFQPACLNFAIEVSELAVNDATAFQEFLTLETAFVASIRAQHPNLPLMVSVALKSPGTADAQTIATAMPAAVTPVDWLGLSLYPYAFFSHADKGDPANLPANWFSQGVDLAAGKPIIVAETGWIAEDLVEPTFSLNVPATPADQDAYVTALMEQAHLHDARLVVWFFVADFDEMWNGVLAQDPIARIWRDTGLFDGMQQPRPALATWDAERAKPIAD